MAASVASDDFTDVGILQTGSNAASSLSGVSSSSSVNFEPFLMAQISQQQQQQQPQQQPQQQQPQQASQSQPGADLIKKFLPSLPFFFLLALKFLYDHKVGLILFVCFVVIFAKCNDWAVRLIAESRSSDRPSVNRLTRMMTMPFRSSWPQVYRIKAAVACLVNCACMLGIMYAFSDQSLWLCMICLPPTVASFGFWTLLFTVTVTDMLLKFGIVAVKMAVLWILDGYLSMVDQTRAYVITERSYQVYRQLTPIGVWLATLVDGESNSWIYTSLLVSAYGIFKLHSLYTSALPQLKALFRLATSPVLFPEGFSTGATGFGAGSVGAADCPICQEPVHHPIQLPCSHVFCFGCLHRWLGQSRTCPMCRQPVATETPAGQAQQDPLAWMDGSTCSDLQIY